jgi:sterol desaturase/sphingolipid hydroxylase (fatty acid hydroxylase superfamily)
MLWLILAVGIACMAIERAAPGWTLPSARIWPLRVVTLNLVQLGVVLLAGVTWERWLQGPSLLDLGNRLSPLAGALAAYFVATFVFYWWHRWRHESDLLWRLFHQIHHSPQRLELITSFYKHPAEMVVNSAMGAVLVYPLLGLDLDGAAIYTACTALGEFFYHTNVRTPQWIGYFFQRPEMHRIHHEHARHRNNYGDIVWWDMLFGTYENPPTFDTRCGFDEPREQRLVEMLAWRDVHRS